MITCIDRQLQLYRQLYDHHTHDQYVLSSTPIPLHQSSYISSLAPILVHPISYSNLLLHLLSLNPLFFSAMYGSNSDQELLFDSLLSMGPGEATTTTTTTTMMTPLVTTTTTTMMMMMMTPFSDNTYTLATLDK